MIITVNEFFDLEKYNNYKLCYLRYIPEIINEFTDSDDLDEETAALKDSKFSNASQVKEMFNPMYKSGEREMLAYFTPVKLIEQSGDCWDSAPYTYYAGLPFNEDYDIIRIPCAVHSYSYFTPASWVYDNSPFSLDDINGGAVAWIYDRNDNNKSVAIYAGVNPSTFFKQLNEIAINHPEWKEE
jgi:hypothetical protein